MIFRRFYEPQLAQTSYLVGCTTTRSAIVVDPNRDVEQYLNAAAAEGVTISHVTETHIHADFVSGSRELAARSGARLLLSAEGGPDWQYAFAGEADAVLLRDGDSFSVGLLRFDVVHTPGHTPEHLTFVVTDPRRTAAPVGALTGDFLLVGDVGRPDLLERAAGVVGSMEDAARTLFHSLRRLEPYPDHLQIWPGHGAGSACGKDIGALPQSTLGYERLVNWALQIAQENAFVHRVLSGQPDAPPYFGRMKRVNKAGPPPLGTWPAIARLSLDRLEAELARGTTVVDVRGAADFAIAHVPGTLNLPLNGTFTTWAGWLLPPDRDLVLITDAGSPAEDVVRHLALIGIERVIGFANAKLLQRWASLGRRLGRVPQVNATTLEQMMRQGRVVVLDVRSSAEWSCGHIPGAHHIPLGCLPGSLSSLPTGAPIVVHCQGGGRSAIAASLLLAQARAPVSNLDGGVNEWLRAGYAVEREQAIAADV